MKSESMLATVWVMVLRLVELHGLAPQRFLQELGVPPEILRDVGARLPSRLVDVGFERAAAQVSDPAFALRAAQCWHPSNLGTIGYAWLSSRTLHTGLKRIERFSHILGNRSTVRCIEETSGLRFVFDHGRGDALVGYPMADFALSVFLGMCRTNFGKELNPSAVYLRRPVPAAPRPWRRFFGCPIQFGAVEDCFVLDLESANAPLPSANIPLANTFDAMLTEQLARLFNDDIVSRCKNHVLRQLTSGVPSPSELARALGLSRRSLQRRLRTLGLTYQKVLDETRHELARPYLDDRSKSLGEIAFLLGFSEQSAFTRAFKHWSGMAPTIYRCMPIYQLAG
jgi:AraC-like DNA-binding protein